VYYSDKARYGISVSGDAQDFGRESKALLLRHSTAATLKEGNEDIREQEQAKNVKLFLREP